jgi:pimeloyl-ACP methyl ester carboxylesterase
MATPSQSPKAQFEPPLWLGKENDGLAYYVFNSEGAESILFLHGAMTAAREWEFVLPHIAKQYHIIVPDVPLHNRSRNTKLEHPGIDTGSLLRDLIKISAKGGQAHVVGLSMGAHIGRRLAVQCPEVVKTCFLSGYAHLDGMPMKEYLPYIVYAVEYVGTKVPRSWIDGIEYATDTETPHDFGHFKKVWNLIMDNADVKDKAWAARTLVVAASKGGLIPTNDSIADARTMALLARQKNSETMAVQNKTMRHGWSRQDPKLFAEAVMCWIESKPLPVSFEPI